MSDRIISLGSLPDIDPLPLDENRPTKVMERRALALFARSRAKITRDWREVPANPERIRLTANLLRAEFGDCAVRKVEGWAVGDTHHAIGVPFDLLLVEMRMADSLGLKPTRDGIRGRWTHQEVWGANE